MLYISMDQLEKDLKLILEGQAVPVSSPDVETSDSFVPVTKRNIGYIVCGILLNDNNEVLMMQEAKESCYGRWYLPAGRVEMGENFRAGVMREVEEETGLICEPTTLLAVEFGSGRWYRFTFTGKVTGGKLKTLKDKDEESLQAKWVNFESIKTRDLKLRADDIIPLIEIALRHKATPVGGRHPDTMPAIQAYPRLLLRLVISNLLSDQTVQVLVNKSTNVHFPCVRIAPNDFSASICCFRVLKEVFGKHNLIPQICGLLSLEHCGIPAQSHDGMCITLMASLDVGSSRQIPDIINPDYEWHTVEDADVALSIKTRLQNNGYVPFICLH